MVSRIFLLAGLCGLILVPSHVWAQDAETSEGDANSTEICPPETAAQKEEQNVCTGQFGCSNGTTFLFPKEYVWEEGEYSILMTFDGQKVICHGEISLENCKSPDPFFTCEGAYKAYVDIEGCPDMEEDHGHGHDYVDDFERNENYTIEYHPAQEIPYIARVGVYAAADDISIKVSRPEDVLGSAAVPKTIHEQQFTGPSYKTYRPNGPECLPICRYGAELEIKGLE